MPIRKIRKIIKEIQLKDLAIRRRWHKVLSGGTIAIVVLLWGVYINSRILSVSPAPAVIEVKKDFVASPSVISVFKKSGAVLYDNVVSEARELINQIAISRSFMVEVGKPDFVLDSLPKVPYQKLQ